LAGLVVREIDPENGSRTINAVTAIGWLVYFYRAGFALPGLPNDQDELPDL